MWLDCGSVSYLWIGTDLLFLCPSAAHQTRKVSDSSVLIEPCRTADIWPFVQPYSAAQKGTPAKTTGARPSQFHLHKKLAGANRAECDGCCCRQTSMTTIWHDDQGRPYSYDSYAAVCCVAKCRPILTRAICAQDYRRNKVGGSKHSGLQQTRIAR